MQDLSLYVNEVKRDNEALQLINEIQNSIVDLKMVCVFFKMDFHYCISFCFSQPQKVSLKDYGRLLRDGELKVKAHVDNKLRNRFVGFAQSNHCILIEFIYFLTSRYVFLFDKVLLMCKSRVSCLSRDSCMLPYSRTVALGTIFPWQILLPCLTLFFGVGMFSVSSFSYMLKLPWLTFCDCVVLHDVS
jgi:hypothetical protein